MLSIDIDDTQVKEGEGWEKECKASGSGGEKRMELASCSILLLGVAEESLCAPLTLSCQLEPSLSREQR